MMTWYPLTFQTILISNLKRTSMKQLFTVTALVTFFLVPRVGLHGQCAPGPFLNAPTNPLELTCDSAVTFDDFSLCLDLDIENTGFGTRLTGLAGNQICISLPAKGTYIFSTCELSDDDTMITIFDAQGNVLDSNDDFCNLQAQLFFEATAGQIVCYQVDSFFCTDDTSTSPEFSVNIVCPPIPTTCIGEVSFNETIIIDDNSGIEMGSTSSNLFTFSTGNEAPDGGNYVSGVLTVCAQGDISSTTEGYQVVDESGNCIGETQANGNDCADTPTCTIINLSETDLANYLVDGTIVFDARGSGDTSGFCDVNLVSMQLELCSVLPFIPTMGEWGMICLGLLLLIFGVKTVAEGVSTEGETLR